MQFNNEVAKDALDAFSSEYESSNRKYAALESRATAIRAFRRSDWIAAKVDPLPVALAVLHFQRVVVCAIVALSHCGQEI